MHDRQAFWLILMNAILGLALVLLILGIVTGVLCNVASAWRKRRRVLRDLDTEIETLFDEHRAGGHHRK